MWITKVQANFSCPERLFICRSLKIVELWFSSWYLSHLSLVVKFAGHAFDSSHWEERLGTIWKLSILHFSNVLNSVAHEMSIVNVLIEMGILKVRRVIQENNILFKDQSFGAMKIREEWLQDAASLNLLLIFAVSSLSHFLVLVFAALNSVNFWPKACLILIL